MMMAKVPRVDAPAASRPARRPLAASSFVRAGRARMPARMASTGSRSEREMVQTTYQALLDSYDQLLRDSGQYGRLRSNVAGALTFLLVSSHHALNSGTELSESQQEQVLQDLNSALAETPAFRNLSDAQRQDMFETAAIVGTYVLTMYRLGQDQGRPEHQRVARDVADLALEQMLGVRLSGLELTDGVRIR